VLESVNKGRSVQYVVFFGLHYVLFSGGMIDQWLND